MCVCVQLITVLYYLGRRGAGDAGWARSARTPPLVLLPLGGLEGHSPCREGCCSACATHTHSSSAPALPSTGLKAAPTAAGKGSLHRGVLVGSGLFSDPLTLQLLCVLLSRGVA